MSCYHDIVELTAAAHILEGSPESGEALLRRTLKGTSDTRTLSRFLYLLALHVHYRRQELPEAKAYFERALERCEAQWGLRSRALLMLGRITSETQDFVAAERAYEQVLYSRVRKYWPRAIM